MPSSVTGRPRSPFSFAHRRRRVAALGWGRLAALRLPLRRRRTPSRRARCTAGGWLQAAVVLSPMRGALRSACPASRYCTVSRFRLALAGFPVQLADMPLACVLHPFTSLRVQRAVASRVYECGFRVGVAQPAGPPVGWSARGARPTRRCFTCAQWPPAYIAFCDRYVYSAYPCTSLRASRTARRVAEVPFADQRLNAPALERAVLHLVFTAQVALSVASPYFA